MSCPCLPEKAGGIYFQRLTFLFLSKRELLTQYPCDPETTGEGLKSKEAEVGETLLPLDVSWGGQSQEEGDITGASPCRYKSWVGGETKG